MSEMALTAEHLIVIGRGKLIADTSVKDFLDSASRQAVRVRTTQAVELRDLLAGAGVHVTNVEHEVLEVSGLTGAEIGKVACAHSIALEELTPVQASLEEAFMELTRDAVEYGESHLERKAS